MMVRLADLNICIEHKHAYMAYLCRNYHSSSKTADFAVRVSEADILEEDAGLAMPDYAESLAVYRAIAEQMPLHGGFLMHGSVIDVDGSGVAFLAKSGVGKSTHTERWKMFLGDRVQIVNGDKPLVRFRGEIPYAYGTPWAGKEGLETNMCTPLRKICFFARGEENKVEKCRKEDVLLQLLPQIYMPKTKESIGCLLECIARLIPAVDFYSIHCNLHADAAETVYRAIFK